MAKNRKKVAVVRPGRTKAVVHTAECAFSVAIIRERGMPLVMGPPYNPLPDCDCGADDPVDKKDR